MLHYSRYFELTPTNIDIPGVILETDIHDPYSSSTNVYVAVSSLLYLYSMLALPKVAHRLVYFQLSTYPTNISLTLSNTSISVINSTVSYQILRKTLIYRSRLLLSQ